MADPQVVFPQTFEGLFDKGLKGRVTPRLRARLRELGLDLGGPLKPGYPVEVWPRAVDAAADELYPELSRDEAHWRLGEDFIRGYADTMLGKAMFGVLSVIGPMKALARMERNFRSGNNYLQTRFTELGPRRAQVWMSEVHEQPGFNGGVIRAGGQLIGANNLQVAIGDCDGKSCTYVITWDG